MATIIIDDREAYNVEIDKLLEIYAKISGFNVTIKKERIHVADYAITVNDTFVMLFERKTWKDIAGSIGSRLPSQIENMVTFRKEHKCKIAFLIEGSFCFSPKDRIIGGKQFSALQSTLRHNLIKHDISYVYTKDQSHTAQTLIDFATDYIILLKEGKITLEGNKVGGYDNALALLKVKKDKSDEEITLNIWRALPGVSDVTGFILSEKYKLHEIIAGTISIDEIAKIKYPSGKQSIGPKRAKNICTINNKSAIKILTELPGISKTSAIFVLKSHKLIELCTMIKDELAQIPKTESGRKIGPKLAKTILQYLGK